MREKNTAKQKMLWKQASFTVEASIIFPMIVFLTAIVVNLAIEQYQSVDTYAQKVIRRKEYDPVSVIKTKAGLVEKAKCEDKEGAP